MHSSTNFATGTAQGAAVAHTYQVGAIYSQVLPLSGRRFATFFLKKENFVKNLFTFVSTDTYFNLAKDFKQKASLATNGCWSRKVQRHLLSDMCRSTLKVAFLFINIVK